MTSSRIRLKLISRDDAEDAPKCAAFLRQSIQAFGDGQVEFFCPICELVLIRGATRGWVQRTTILCECGNWLDFPTFIDYRITQGSTERLRPLFRGFTERAHLESFLRGSIRISSLDSWRKTEDAARVDAGEGVATHTIDLLAAHQLDDKGASALRRIGVGLPVGAKDVLFKDVVGIQKTPNAPGLSMSRNSTQRMREKMGGHWIRLDSPAEFFERVSSALAQRYQLRFASVMPVVYRPRETRNDEPEIGPPFLVKPASYAEESEIRFIWFVQDPATVGTFTDIDIGDATSMCVDVS